ncbi:MAG TPA: class I SAM-dependent methyltransferase [Candidatus Dormibacteraeota bacterium]
MSRPGGVRPLTDESYWDAHWQGLRLPIAVDETRARPYQRAILRVFTKFVTPDPGGRALEIGGAPGGYLAYVARTFGLEAHAIDSSPVGCRQLEENFRLLQIPIHVYCRDALSGDLSDLPRFDLVYSLGLIEHFSDPVPMIRKHVELAKPGALVVIGLPNFLGISAPIMRLTRPEVFSAHNLRTMDLRTWDAFQQEMGLEVVFRGYVGGWEPRIYASRRKGVPSLMINAPIWAAAKVMDALSPARARNARAWSGYAMGVYRTPGA